MKNLFFQFVTVSFNTLCLLFLQTPQKQEKQVTPKKTPEKRNDDDEYAGSTDVDEPGLHPTTLIESSTVEKWNWTLTDVSF